MREEGGRKEGGRREEGGRKENTGRKRDEENFFLMLVLMSVHKRFHLNRSSRLAGYTQHIYMNVLFYYMSYFRYT